MFFLSRHIGNRAIYSSVLFSIIAAVVIVCLVACGGGASSSTSIAPLVTTSQISLQLNANRYTGVAPLAVSFDTVGTQANSTSLPFHEIKYSWNFGDVTGGAVWAYGTRAGIANKNIAHGPVAAHIFETPGIYVVTLSAFDGSNTKNITTTITVTDPNIVFSSNTVCVSNTVLPVAGSDGCPAGANSLIEKDWVEIGFHTSKFKRILLRKGDSWNASGQAVFSTGPGILGSFGSGASPSIHLSSNSNGLYFTNSHDWRLMDLEISSTVTAGSFALNDKKVPVRSINSNFLTIFKCHFHDFYIGVLPELSDSFSVFESNIHNSFPVYGNMVAFFYKGARVSLVGNKFSTSETTHTVRISGTNNAVVSNNHIDTPGPTRDALTVRGWEAPTPYTQYIVLSDNVIDGGSLAGYLLYVGIVNKDTNEELRDILVERNLIKSTSNEIPSVFKVAQNLTFRNNITSAYSEIGISIMGGGNSVGAPSPRSSYVLNNTFYKSSNILNTRYSVAQLNGDVSGVVFVNNLAYAPGTAANAGWLGTGPTFLYTSAGALQSNAELINNSTDMQIKNNKPWSENTPINPMHFKPDSYAVRSGYSSKVWDDFSLVKQPTVRSIGAIIP